MFIKRDLRKIDEIINESKKDTLIFSKRQSEFSSGTIKNLTIENKLSCYSNLKILNLYDNALTNVDGIHLLGTVDEDQAETVQSKLEELNLGFNKLSSLPMEIGSLKSLQSLWLDDNEFDEFPVAICQLHGLKALHLSNNNLQSIPISISSLINLETLAIDNNSIENFPDGCLKLKKLKHLWLRQNRLNLLPDNIDEMNGLVTLSISSNHIVTLPDSIANITSLMKIYANGNKIENVPSNLPNLVNLEVLNLANNCIRSIPIEWMDKWGPYNNDTKSITVDKKLNINLFSNNIQS